MSSLAESFVWSCRGGEICTPWQPDLYGQAGPLWRFLRAEKYNADKADKRLRCHAAWRAEFVPRGRIHEVQAQCGHGRIVTHIPVTLSPGVVLRCYRMRSRPSLPPRRCLCKAWTNKAVL